MKSRLSLLLVGMLLLGPGRASATSPRIVPSIEPPNTEDFVYALEDGDPKSLETLRNVTEMARDGNSSALVGLEEINDLMRTTSIEKDGMSVMLPGGWQASPQPPFLDLTDKDEFTGISVSSYHSVISVVIERSPYSYIEKLRALMDEELPNVRAVDMSALAGIQGHGLQRAKSPTKGYAMFSPDSQDLDNIRILYVIKSEPNPRRLPEMNRILSSLRVTPVPVLSDTEWREILDAVKTRTDYEYDHVERHGMSLLKVSIKPGPNQPEATRLRLTFRLRSGHWVEDKTRTETFSIPAD
jgi:hypothetical protein